MKILNSLLISLSISAALISNESDSFKQKDYAQANNAHEKLNNKYKISGEQILKGANIAGAAVGVGIGSCVLFTDASGKLMAALMFAGGAMLNGTSAIIDPKKNPNVSTGLGIANAVWGLGNMALCLWATSSIMPFQFYWFTKSALNISNAAYRLWYAKKQQN